ncbi:MAG: hypothetical protein QM775_12235 [Pirellulales bacterium]
MLVWALALQAPLEEPASSVKTPNPSKAPWYFLGLQEMLVYYDPWYAGVVLPSIVVFGLMAIPFLDFNKAGNGYYTISQSASSATSSSNSGSTNSGSCSSSSARSSAGPTGTSSGRSSTGTRTRCSLKTTSTSRNTSGAACSAKACRRRRSAAGRESSFFTSSGARAPASF